MALSLEAIPGSHKTFRFALPPSLAASQLAHRARLLEAYLGRSLRQESEVLVPDSYQGLAKQVLSGKVDAAWAPPFVCARMEAMGVRVLVRGVRRGAASYRAALISRSDSPLALDELLGRRAAWTDRDSTAGYLLAMALLRSRGLDPKTLFATQDFTGSYAAALEALLSRRADVTSVFAPAAREGLPPGQTGVDEIAPRSSQAVRVVAFTEEAPNAGVAIAVTTPPEVASALERSLLDLGSTPEGATLLKEVFNAEQFEPAPRMSYRALYRVALASL